MNPHRLWADGPYKITCFRKGRDYPKGSGLSEGNNHLSDELRWLRSPGGTHHSAGANPEVERCIRK